MAAPNVTVRISSTFLTHYFGKGLTDELYAIERYKTTIDGEIRRLSKGRQVDCLALSLAVVLELRPARNEIIICTGKRRRGGIQYWGDLATGLFAEGKRKRQ